jgi:RHS repeat-associated protein
MELVGRGNGRSKIAVSALLGAIGVVTTMMLSSGAACAQADFEKGFQAYQSYHGSDFDTVNLANGNLILNIPLLSYGQRGALPPVVISIRSNSTTFQSAPPFQNGPPDTKQHEVASGIVGAPWGQPHVVIDPGGLSWREERIVTGSNGAHLTRFVATDASGATHSLGGAIANSVQGNVPGIMYSVDGSGLMLQPATASRGPVLVDRAGNIGGLIDPNGNAITLQGPCAKPAGGGDFFSPALPSWEGNAYGTASATSIVDTVGRVIPNPSHLPPAAAFTCLVDLDASYHAPLLDSLHCGVGQSGTTQYGETWDFPGQNSGKISLIFCYDNILVSANIPTPVGGPGNFQYETINEHWWVLTSVTLPNQMQWKFIYDNYGQVQSVTMPTGATVSYEYQNNIQGQARLACGNPPGQIPVTGTPAWPFSNLMSSRMVTKRTLDLKDGTPGKFWTYSSTIGSGWASNPNSGKVTVTDPYNNATVHTFALISNAGQPVPVCGPYETLTQYFQGSNTSVTPLKTVATKYSSTGSDFANPTNFSNYIAAGVFPSQVTTTLGAQVSQDQYIYDSYGSYQDYVGMTHRFSFGQVLSTTESDWGGGAPGAIIRTTLPTRFWQSNWKYYAANLIDLPCLNTVFSGNYAGTQPSCTAPAPPGTQVSQTSYVYDESLYAPPGTRGNLTSVAAWLKGGTSPTAHTAYNANGMPFQKIDPLGNTTTITYDSTGLYPNKVQAPNTTYGATVTQHIEVPTFDTNTGELLSQLDENGNTTTFTYDNMRRLTNVAYPKAAADGVAGTETYTYTDTPHSISSPLTPNYTFTQKLDRNGTTAPAPFNEQGIADALGRKIQTIIGQTTPITPIRAETTYDNLGRVATVTNPHYSTASPTDGATSYVYDALSRVCVIGRPDGAPVSQATGCPATAPSGDVFTKYTSNCTTVTDEAGNQRKSCSDALGRMTDVFEAPNLTTTYNYATAYAYDVLGNLRTVSQKGGSTVSTQWRPRSFTYDSLSRLLCAANPEIQAVTCPALASGTFPFGATTYTYDADGNLLTKKAPSPNQPATGTATVTTTFAYDALNRITGKSYADTFASNPATSGVTYGYDGVLLTCPTPIGFAGASTIGIGRRTSICFGAGSKSWNYDARGRVASLNDRLIGPVTPFSNIVVTIGGVPTISTNRQFSYYLNGDLLAYSYPNPNGPISGSFVTGEDAAGRVTSAADNFYQMLASPTYAPAGQMLTGLVGTNTIANTYNKRLQPVLLSASTAAAAKILNLTYNFNLGNGATGTDNGNVIQIANGKDPNRTQNFTYDALNRIQQAYTNGPNWGETFGPLATGPGVAPATPGIDAWGNLTNRSGVTGKTLTEALSCPASANNQLTTCFTYDAAGNLIKNGTATYTYDAENRIITTAGTSYIYDGDGQRIEKCTAGTTAGTCSSTATGTYYWKQGDGGTIAEADLHGNWTTAYGLIRGKIASRVDLPANTLHYYFNDHLGTTSVVTSAAGVVQKESDYFPYGGEIAIVSGDANRYKFTGKERDAESSLDNFGARYYASSMGRFMTPDKPFADQRTADPQSWNLFGYARNNPLTFVDSGGFKVLQKVVAEAVEKMAALKNHGGGRLYLDYAGIRGLSSKESLGPSDFNKWHSDHSKANTVVLPNKRPFGGIPAALFGKTNRDQADTGLAIVQEWHKRHFDQSGITLGVDTHSNGVNAAGDVARHVSPGTFDSATIVAPNTSSTSTLQAIDDADRGPFEVYLSNNDLMLGLTIHGSMPTQEAVNKFGDDVTVTNQFSHHLDDYSKAAGEPKN